MQNYIFIRVIIQEGLYTSNARIGDRMSKVCCGPRGSASSSPLPSSPTTPHTGAGWHPSCMGRWETAAVAVCPVCGVGLRVKADFHYGCALHCIAWREIQRHGQCFYFYHHATPCNTTRSRRNGNKPLSKHSACQWVERRWLKILWTWNPTCPSS